MKVIRKVVNDAVNEDLLPVGKNPFVKYKLKTNTVLDLQFFFCYHLKAN